MRPIDSSIVRFHRIDPGAIPPMRADTSALGGIPAVAFQYCEALRTASSFGWYIFPPRDIRLRWDGSEVFHEVDGAWRRLSSEVDPEFQAYWLEHCPGDMRDCALPYISPLFVPGIVQIWSGLTVSTAPGWSVHIRPLANIPLTRAYACYEGIVETDWFNPCPLFINIRMLSTDGVIEIPRTTPLFQVQPVHRDAYGAALATATEGDGLEIPHDDPLWQGIRNTIRSIAPERPPDVGRYAAQVRKRAKSRGK
jgi:uncharacterized protein DUF6065